MKTKLEILHDFLEAKIEQLKNIKNGDSTNKTK